MKVILKKNILTKYNDKKEIVWTVDLLDPFFYDRIKENEEKSHKTIQFTDMPLKHFVFGAYHLMLPFDGEKVYLALNNIPIKYEVVFPLYLLHPSMVIQDVENKKYYEIVGHDQVVLGPGKFGDRFGYSPYGWVVHRYALKETNIA